MRERYYVITGQDRAWVMRRDGMSITTVAVFPFGDYDNPETVIAAAKLTAQDLNQTGRAVAR